jgi:AcrR family transcriptional regulator
MSDARDELLQRVVADVAANGIGDRSLRDLAAAVDSSHRMLLYHFGSREGLVAAIVGAVEDAQREVLRELATQAGDPYELVHLLWERVSSPELLPFVRLFFEALAATPPEQVDRTAPWLDVAEDVVAGVGESFDPAEVRLGVAITRGLLVDVLMTGDRASATESLDRFVAIWRSSRAAP